MSPADEMPAKIEAPESTSAPADFGQKLGEHGSLSGFERTQDKHRPVEDLHSLLLRISHHLDYETSERSTIYYRLLAIDAQAKRIENQTKRRALRALVRYAVVVCIAVAGTLAWQSYGGPTKKIIATVAPELGWSPEAKQMIANWVQELGWTNTDPDIAPVRQLVAARLHPAFHDRIHPGHLDPAGHRLGQDIGARRHVGEEERPIGCGRGRLGRRPDRKSEVDRHAAQRRLAPALL